MTDVLGDPHVTGLWRPEQVINLIAEQTETLRQTIADCPGPYDPLNGQVYIAWERRLMLRVGVVQGMLRLAKAVQLLPVETSEVILREAVGMTERAIAAIVSGERG